MPARRPQLLLGLLFTVLAFLDPAFAQNETSWDRLTIHAGGGLLVSETDHTVDNLGPLTVEPLGAVIRVQRPLAGLSLGIGYQLGSYPYVTPAGRREARHTVRLLGEWAYPTLRHLEPYVGAGPVLAIASGRAGAGVSANAGVRTRLTEGLAVFAEGIGHLVWPDEAVDATAGGRASFDALGLLAFGVHIQPMGR